MTVRLIARLMLTLFAGAVIGPRAVRLEIRRAYRMLYRGSLRIGEDLPRLRETVTTAEGRGLLAFFEQPSRRRYCTIGDWKPELRSCAPLQPAPQERIS